MSDAVRKSQYLHLDFCLEYNHVSQEQPVYIHFSERPKQLLVVLPHQVESGIPEIHVVPTGLPPSPLQ